MEEPLFLLQVGVLLAHTHKASGGICVVPATLTLTEWVPLCPPGSTYLYMCGRANGAYM